MKYVIVRSLGVEVARLASEVEGHLDLVKSDEKVIAAGFCSLEPADFGIKVHVWGHSHGLKVENRGAEDGEIIFKTITFRS